MYHSRITDRQVGRNAEVFARAIAACDTPEERYPFLRILVSIIEQAHPEWNHTPQKGQQVAHLIDRMAPRMLNSDEIVEIVRVRDEERGYFRNS